MNRGIVRQSQGDPLPVSDFNKALEVLDEIKDPGYFLYRSLFGNQVRMNRANVLEDAGHYREALADHNQIVDLYRQLIDVGMTEHVALLAKALGNRGNVHADLMLSDQAIADYDGAIVLYEDLTRLGRLDVRPDLLHVRLVRAATLSEAGRAGEARDALDDCLHAYTQLLNQGRSDLEAEAALAWMNRALACLLLGKPAEALADADRAVVAYRQLEHSGRADLVGYRAHAQMIRAAARFGCHDRSGEATDRAEGIATFQQLIAAGQKALRFVFVRKVIVAARYLTPGAQPEASALLAAALTELETAVREGQAVEAMRLEARRGLKEICHVAERFDKDLFDRLIAFAELA
jgi:tetratricopeptide (TPR) repeat protein